MLSTNRANSPKPIRTNLFFDFLIMGNQQYIQQNIQPASTLKNSLVSQSRTPIFSSLKLKNQSSLPDPDTFSQRTFLSKNTFVKETPDFILLKAVESAVLPPNQLFTIPIEKIVGVPMIMGWSQQAVIKLPHFRRGEKLEGCIGLSKQKGNLFLRSNDRGNLFIRLPGCDQKLQKGNCLLLGTTVILVQNVHDKLQVSFSFYGQRQQINIVFQPFVIGSSPSADLSLPDPALSPAHLQIFQNHGNWYVKDLASLNGSWIGVRWLEVNQGTQWLFGLTVFQAKFLYGMDN